MIYIEEKDGMLYKYKVDIDEERLKELMLKIEEGNFYYIGSLGKDILDFDDVDFEYTKFDQKNLLSNNGDMLGPCYELVHCSKLYIIIGRLLGYEDEVKCHRDDLYFADQVYPLDRKIDSEYLKLLSLIELLKYDGEEDLVSLIDEEIKERIKVLESKKNKFDFGKKFKEACKIKELYKQREEAASLLDVSKLYESVMETISFEKVDEISEEDYEKYLDFTNQSYDTYVRVQGNGVQKYKVTFNRDNMRELLDALYRNTGYKPYVFVRSTKLEDILRDVFDRKANISELINYNSDEEEINIFRKECSERYKEIEELLNKKEKNEEDLKRITELLEAAKKDFPNAEYNMKVKLPQTYYKKIMSRLKFTLVSTMDLEEYARCEKFESEVNKEIVSRLVLSK